MVIFTNNKDFSDYLLDISGDWIPFNKKIESETICQLTKNLFQKSIIYKTEITQITFWEYLFISDFSKKSQYDLLLEIDPKIDLPDKILCFAKEGNKFHGQNNREWISLPGNVHIAVYFSPNTILRQIRNGAMVLGVISALQTIDSFDSLQEKAQIKWVNDILIERKKVCGIISHSRTRNKNMKMLLLGIGLNVEAAPYIPAGKFVQKTTCLKDLSKIHKNCTLPIVFKRLLFFLKQNYEKILDNHHEELIQVYRNRSLVKNKHVKIVSNRSNNILADGIVQEINDDLSLLIGNSSQPIRNGRLVLME